MNKPPVQPEPTLMLAEKPQIHCSARKSELQDHLCGLGLLLQNHACVSGHTAGRGAANNGSAGMGGRGWLEAGEMSHSALCEALYLLFNISVYAFLNLKTLSTKMFISRD